jgi:hypothetical protein
MNLRDAGLDLFSARMLFRGLPDAAVVCPVCERTEVELVSVEVRRGSRRTVIDGSGVRHTARSLGDGSGGDADTPPFEMHLTFDCGVHESTLRLEAADGGIAALVDVRLASPSGPALCPRAPTSASRHAKAGSSRRPAKLVLVTPGRGQPCLRGAKRTSSAVLWRSSFFMICLRWASTVFRLRDGVSAISALVRPSAMSWRISRSRPVSRVRSSSASPEPARPSSR